LGFNEKSFDRQQGGNLSDPMLRQFNEFAAIVNKFGVNFSLFDDRGGLLLLSDAGMFESDCDRLGEYSRQSRRVNDDTAGVSDDRQCLLAGDHTVIGASVQLDDGSKAVAMIDLGNCSGDFGDNQTRGAGRSNPGIDSRVGSETLDVAVAPQVDYLSEILRLFVENLELRCNTHEQIEDVSTQLSQTYEELVLLHKLSTNMKVTESDANYLQMACDNLTDIVSVEGIAILLEKKVEDERKLVLSAGSGLIDTSDHLAAVLHDRLLEELNNGKEALLDSEIETPFKYKWPENMKNLIAVPLYGTDRSSGGHDQGGCSENSVIGLMVAINVVDRPDFDSTDIKLFNSVSNQCAVFVENGRLFKDLKELFIGSLKALTNSIDAKDQYTRGHSERVAFISRWIAERLGEQEPMAEELIHKIYLAGLLHDIGKMGIDESVLRKEGKLTDEEFDHIRTHPSIGGGILGDIKQMKDIVPGVLCHHERADGRGYPEGLSSEHIPLIGKIVGLADGFDAMTSKRVYRDAMSVEKALDEIRKGLGSQFDERIGRLFLESDVYQLWDIIQDGSDFFGLDGKSKLEQYGAQVVGTLLR
jgi:HD-GYP domain-containing protein (c-di-GMP phosphodiesterase class II)